MEKRFDGRLVMIGDETGIDKSVVVKFCEEKDRTDPGWRDRVNRRTTEILREISRPLDTEIPSLVKNGWPEGCLNVIDGKDKDGPFDPRHPLLLKIAEYFREFGTHMKNEWLWVEAPVGRGKTTVISYMARRFHEKYKYDIRYIRFADLLEMFRDKKYRKVLLTGYDILCIDDFGKADDIWKSDSQKVLDLLDYFYLKKSLWLLSDLPLDVTMKNFPDEIYESAGHQMTKYREQISSRIISRTCNQKYFYGMGPDEGLNLRTGTV